MQMPSLTTLTTLALTLALSASATVYITHPVTGDIWTAGSKATVTWIAKDNGTLSDAPIQLEVLAGDPKSLTPIAIVATGVSEKNGNHTFPVPKDWVSAKSYVVRTGSLDSYSSPFEVKGVEGSIPRPPVGKANATPDKVVAGASGDGSPETTKADADKSAAAAAGSGASSLEVTSLPLLASLAMAPLALLY
ncbi:MAG: hypothetical protein DHS80DRAFT_26392 [Piptocephalis tieghemiana]|nr:MAG: hypothetical protein DHS80DRAFT_26392 [Piptocephalis tieghemiana]